MIDFIKKKAIEKTLLTIDKFMCNMFGTSEKAFVSTAKHFNGGLLFQGNIDCITLEEIVYFLKEIDKILESIHRVFTSNG